MKTRYAITRLAALALLTAGAMFAAATASAEDNMKSEGPKQEHMKSEGMKHDHMQSDGMKADAMKSGQMESGGMKSGHRGDDAMGGSQK